MISLITAVARMISAIVLAVVLVEKMLFTFRNWLSSRFRTREHILGY
jgi:hypothetical protein